MENDDEHPMRYLMQYHSDAGRDQLGPRGYGEYFENKDGLMVCSYFWPAAEPKAVVLLCHGHGSHTQFEWLHSR